MFTFILDKNIGYAREAGALMTLLANLGLGAQNTPVPATEYSVISNSALAISSMARNGIYHIHYQVTF
jgi:hypothetical protein